MVGLAFDASTHRMAAMAFLRRMPFLQTTAIGGGPSLWCKHPSHGSDGIFTPHAIPAQPQLSKVMQQNFIIISRT